MVYLIRSDTKIEKLAVIHELYPEFYTSSALLKDDLMYHSLKLFFNIPVTFCVGK